MLAPKGSAFLFCRPNLQNLLEPLIVSWGWNIDQREFNEKPYYSKFEWLGTRDPAAYLSIPAALNFLEKHNWDTIQKECHKLALQTMQDICNFTGIDPIYPNESYFAQMVTIPLPPISDAVGLKKSLYNRYNIEIPVIEWDSRHFLRLSVQGYNSVLDLIALETALKSLL